MTITEIRNELDIAWLKMDTLRQVLDALEEQGGASLIVREIMDSLSQTRDELAAHDPALDLRHVRFSEESKT